MILRIIKALLGIKEPKTKKSAVQEKNWVEKEEEFRKKLVQTSYQEIESVLEKFGIKRYVFEINCPEYYNSLPNLKNNPLSGNRFISITVKNSDDFEKIVTEFKPLYLYVAIKHGEFGEEYPGDIYIETEPGIFISSDFYKTDYKHRHLYEQNGFVVVFPFLQKLGYRKDEKTSFSTKANRNGFYQTYSKYVLQ